MHTYHRRYKTINVTLWKRKRLLWAGQVNDSRRDYIFAGFWGINSISILVEEGSECCKERNGINKAMMVEYCGLMINSRSAKISEVKDREVYKCSKDIVIKKVKLIANIS